MIKSEVLQKLERVAADYNWQQWHIPREEAIGTINMALSDCIRNTPAGDRPWRLKKILDEFGGASVEHVLNDNYF